MNPPDGAAHDVRRVDDALPFVGAVRASAHGLDSFTYDDDIVRKFMVATFVWGLVGMLVGLLIALQLAVPSLSLAPYLSFGRLRPLHTNAVIFAFAGNAFFTGAYYSTQRLCKARMFSDVLGRFHFWGWQAIIVAAAITAGCETLATEDLQHGRVIDGVRIENPFRDLA